MSRFQASVFTSRVHNSARPCPQATSATNEAYRRFSVDESSSRLNHFVTAVVSIVFRAIVVDICPEGRTTITGSYCEKLSYAMLILHGVLAALLIFSVSERLHRRGKGRAPSLPLYLSFRSHLIAPHRTKLSGKLREFPSLSAVKFVTVQFKFSTLGPRYSPSLFLFIL